MCKVKNKVKTCFTAEDADGSASQRRGVQKLYNPGHMSNSDHFAHFAIADPSQAFPILPLDHHIALEKITSFFPDMSRGFDSVREQAAIS